MLNYAYYTTIVYVVVYKDLSVLFPLCIGLSVDVSSLLYTVGYIQSCRIVLFYSITNVCCFFLSLQSTYIRSSYSSFFFHFLLRLLEYSLILSHSFLHLLYKCIRVLMCITFLFFFANENMVSREWLKRRPYIV